jgi:hypothetical protein
MATAPTPERIVEFQRGILQFLQGGAQGASGTLRGRTFEQLELVCRRHFDGATPKHIFGRIDWRVVHELFTFIWTQASEDGRRHWAVLGEDLYGQMEYLHEGPAEPSVNEVAEGPAHAPLYAD